MRTKVKCDTSRVPKTEKNKRTCVVCGESFFAFPSQNNVSCKKKECRSIHRSRSATAAAHITHGMCKTRLYAIWCSMKQRCSSHDSYKHLIICAEWQKFETFYDWALDSGYSDELEIDRKENDLGYCPDNCRWATRQQQNQNTRSRKGSASQYKGVTLVKGAKSKPWRAVMGTNGKNKHLGYFATEEEAARAYDAAAKELHGDFACLNFRE